MSEKSTANTLTLNFLFLGLHFKQNLNDHNTYLVTQENSQYKYWHHKNQIQRQEAQIAEERPSFIRIIIEGMNDYNNVEALIINIFNFGTNKSSLRPYCIYRNQTLD